MFAVCRSIIERVKKINWREGEGKKLRRAARLERRAVRAGLSQGGWCFGQPLLPPRLPRVLRVPLSCPFKEGSGTPDAVPGRIGPKG